MASAAIIVTFVLCSTSVLPQQQRTLSPDVVQQAPARVVAEPSSGLKLVRTWSDGVCRARLVNEGATPARVKEVVLFDLPHDLPPQTQLYGEGFTMLSQTYGTLGKPIDMGLTDRKHYRIPQPDEATVVYSLLTLQPPGGEHLLFGFTSCRRFSGRFHVRPRAIQVVLDCEDLLLEPGKSWELEDFMFASGPERNRLLQRLAEHLARNHSPLIKGSEPVPTGWCSWYCFGSRVTAQQVLSNLDVIRKDMPALKYVQVDDGYQPYMGDWLETGPAFGGGIKDVLRQIRDKGFEPAIWVAPFIAEKDSRLFKEHPDWFMKDADGKPLSADKVTFKGWRRGPWYALDGTHPGVQQFLAELFRVLRELWGCTYFKLDANFWGAMHGGKLHDPTATRIEAYRRGMEAIRKGAGDGLLLGCNHPIWPSLGTIHASRSSGDIKRDWNRFAGTARQNLSRNWQNGRLWWNDPDCVVLSGTLPEDEYRFHSTAIAASGGMLLSGDDLTKATPQHLAVLRKLLPPTGVAAEFDDAALSVGRAELKGKEMLYVFNWDQTPRTQSVKLRRPCRIVDHWTGAALGRHDGVLQIADMPKHSARLLVCEPN